MLLFRILLSLFIFTNINFLFSTDYKLKNIRFSDNLQNKSLRIVLDLTHKAPYTVFSLNNNPRLVIDLESKVSSNCLNLFYIVSSCCGVSAFFLSSM